jgi:L-2-hydroxyglutarate oxidase LhgO
MGYRTDAVVIGAGVVGLAIARALALRGLETIVLEKAAHIGSETSSRSSEVIHAGIYYPPGSMKAELCVRGKALLYDYLEDRGLPHARCGKLIVASDAAEKTRLEAIADRAGHCGVTDLVPVSAEQIAKIEPNVHGAMGLLSPSTGIVDSHQYMLSLQGEFEAAGGAIAFSTPVESGRLASSGEHLIITGGEAAASLGCRVLVNASGLYARDTWLRLTDPGGSSLIPPQYYAKGHYYSYTGQAPFSRLIYPLPGDGGLGVHATLDLAGQVRFGPDVRWVDDLGYGFDDSLRIDFARTIRSYYPAVDYERLQPGYTGIRPKVVSCGEADGDFVIVTEREHGIPGFCSLHGIESPGLTASLAIAENVVADIL